MGPNRTKIEKGAQHPRRPIDTLGVPIGTWQVPISTSQVSIGPNTWPGWGTS